MSTPENTKFAEVLGFISQYAIKKQNEYYEKISPVNSTRDLHPGEIRTAMLAPTYDSNRHILTDIDLGDVCCFPPSTNALVSIIKPSQEQGEMVYFEENIDLSKMEIPFIVEIEAGSCMIITAKTDKAICYSFGRFPS